MCARFLYSATLRIHLHSTLGIVESPGDRPAIVFFDEVNTSHALHVIRQVCLDRRTRFPARIPSGWGFMAACNPYRAPADCAASGWLRPYAVLKEPASFEPYIWGVEGLRGPSERYFINVLCAQMLPPDKVATAEAAIAGAQDVLRRCSPALTMSLRDVKRCLYVAAWVLRQVKGDVFPSNPQDALVLSLGLCYALKLERSKDREALGAAVATSLQVSDSHLDAVLLKTSKELVRQLEPFERDVSANWHLRENLLISFVCIMARVPLFLVGEPGSSKNLALSLLIDKCRGEVAQNAFLKRYPRVQSFPLQCSASTKSDAIGDVFVSAREFEDSVGEAHVRCVVVLDEVALASAEALPVLHTHLRPPADELDDIAGGMAFVGIAHQVLDLSKMNRGLVRIAMSERTLFEDFVHITLPTDALEASETRALVDGFHSLLVDSNVLGRFYGLRDFYAAVNILSRLLRHGPATLAAKQAALLRVVQRCFNGRAGDSDTVMSHLFGLLEWSLPAQIADATRVPVRDLLLECLAEPMGRHLLVSTRQLSAMHDLMRDGTIRLPDGTQRPAEFLSGPVLPGGNAAAIFQDALLRVKECMSFGRILFLYAVPYLHETLYDVLNRRDVVIDAGRYARLAVGPHSDLCYVHKNFRIVLLVEPDEAALLEPPLLNRFEKHVHVHSLGSNQLFDWAHAVAGNSKAALRDMIVASDTSRLINSLAQTGRPLSELKLALGRLVRPAVALALDACKPGLGGPLRAVLDDVINAQGVQLAAFIEAAAELPKDRTPAQSLTLTRFLRLADNAPVGNRWIIMANPTMAQYGGRQTSVITVQPDMTHAAFVKQLDAFMSDSAKRLLVVTLYIGSTVFFSMAGVARLALVCDSTQQTCHVSEGLKSVALVAVVSGAAWRTVQPEPVPGWALVFADTPDGMPAPMTDFFEHRDIVPRRSLLSLIRSPDEAYNKATTERALTLAVSHVHFEGTHSVSPEALMRVVQLLRSEVGALLDASENDATDWVSMLWTENKPLVYLSLASLLQTRIESHIAKVLQKYLVVFLSHMQALPATEHRLAPIFAALGPIAMLPDITQQKVVADFECSYPMAKFTWEAISKVDRELAASQQCAFNGRGSGLPLTILHSITRSTLESDLMLRSDILVATIKEHNYVDLYQRDFARLEDATKDFPSGLASCLLRSLSATGIFLVFHRAVAHVSRDRYYRSTPQVRRFAPALARVAIHRQQRS